jgi:RNA polymerase-associated protein RTF1
MEIFSKQSAVKNNRRRRLTSDSESSDSGTSASESSGSDNEQQMAKKQKLGIQAPTSSQQNPVENKSDLEDGQLTSDSDEEVQSESDSNSEFDDGYGDDLMGNEEDRNYLEKLSEKERETELFKRAERRDQLKRRWEIERKLKQSRKDANQKNKEKKPKIKKPKAPPPKKVIEKPPKVSPPREDPISATSHLLGITPTEELSPNDYSKEDYFDPKERSKERKKNVEANKTDDKRSNAMAQLKVRNFNFSSILI